MDPQEPAQSTPPSGLPGITRALRYRNYRLFFTGQSISLIGTWMQMVALNWYLYHTLNSSPVILGLVGFAGQIPNLVLAPIAGVYADRWNRYRIMLATQTLSMIQAFTIAALVLTHRLTVPQIIPLSLFIGCVNAFDMPARQSFLVSMIGRREDLSNAIALNSSMVNGARLIGPPIAGFLIFKLGEGVCFLLNGLSYLAVLWALLAMKDIPPSAPRRPMGVLEGIGEGWAYAFGFSPTRAILLLLALVSLVGVPYMILMPIFAKDLLHGNARTLGLLYGAAGLGAFAGAAALAARRSVLGLGSRIAWATALFGAGLIAFSFSRFFWLSIGCLGFSGFGMIFTLAGANTILQTIVSDDMRGRIMSCYAMAFMGMVPLGSLLAGTLARQLGAPHTIALGGVCCLVGAAVFASRLHHLRALVRPIYADKGIVSTHAPR